jgi:uncharacterized DUF497 family protein
MTKIKISQLVWEKWNREHLKKHNVTVAEVEEAILNIKAHRQGYSGRILLIGKAGIRILTLVIAPIENKKYYPVTARDADKKERRLIHENEND